MLAVKGKTGGSNPHSTWELGEPANNLGLAFETRGAVPSAGAGTRLGTQS